MAIIYPPQGAAGEYSPLAINYIKGCSHGCVYCYVPRILKRFNKDYVHSDVSLKEESTLLKSIRASARKIAGTDKQVFFSFTTDPYQEANDGITRKALEIMLEYKIPVAILSKGGYKILQDLDLFKKFGQSIQVGCSLTFTRDEDSQVWETNAALPQERFDTLRILHENGIRTWASMEPVIIPEQSLEIMDITSSYVHNYRISKLNHLPRQEAKVDWTKFLNDAIAIMRKKNSHFYIKDDLAEYADANTILYPHERDKSHLWVHNHFMANNLFTK